MKLAVAGAMSAWATAEPPRSPLKGDATPTRTCFAASLMDPYSRGRVLVILWPEPKDSTRSTEDAERHSQLDAKKAITELVFRIRQSTSVRHEATPLSSSPDNKPTTDLSTLGVDLWRGNASTTEAFFKFVEQSTASAGDAQSVEEGTKSPTRSMIKATTSVLVAELLQNGALVLSWSRLTTMHDLADSSVASLGDVSIVASMMRYATSLEKQALQLPMSSYSLLACPMLKVQHDWVDYIHTLEQILETVETIPLYEKSHLDHSTENPAPGPPDACSKRTLRQRSLRASRRTSLQTQSATLDLDTQLRLSSLFGSFETYEGIPEPTLFDGDLWHEDFTGDDSTSASFGCSFGRPATRSDLEIGIYARSVSNGKLGKKPFSRKFDGNNQQDRRDKHGSGGDEVTSNRRLANESHFNGSSSGGRRDSVSATLGDFWNSNLADAVQASEGYFILTGNIFGLEVSVKEHCTWGTRDGKPACFLRWIITVQPTGKTRPGSITVRIILPESKATAYPRQNALRFIEVYPKKLTSKTLVAITEGYNIGPEAQGAGVGGKFGSYSKSEQYQRDYEVPHMSASIQGDNRIVCFLEEVKKTGHRIPLESPLTAMLLHERRPFTLLFEIEAHITGGMLTAVRRFLPPLRDKMSRSMNPPENACNEIPLTRAKEFVHSVLTSP